MGPASRLAPGTVGAKARTNRALAKQISSPLSSCVASCPPSVPNSSRFLGESNVSGTDAAYGDLLEPNPSPPISSMLGEIDFGRKPLLESDCSLVAAALNPGMLKHGKIVDVNHLHASLAYAHASVLKRQRGNTVFVGMGNWFHVQHFRWQRRTGRQLPIIRRRAPRG